MTIMPTESDHMLFSITA